MAVSVKPLADHHIEGLRTLVDVVARERKYLARDKAPPLESFRISARDSLAQGNIHFVAERDEANVAGWCQITRLDKPLTCHTGNLAMGVAPDMRGAGIGGQLLAAALEQAWKQGLVRIELTVFDSNTSAIRFYERAGFSIEGELIDAICIDGVYANFFIMGLVNHQSC